MSLAIQKAFAQVRTENLLLRMPELGDLPAILSIEGDPKTNKFRPAGPMKDLSEAKETLDSWTNNWSDHGYGYWAVVLPAESEVIGIGGIRSEMWKGQEVLNLYYRFAPKAWGHGYASELAETAVRMAEEHLPELLLVARIRPVNLPSRKVAERVGLMHTPELDSDEHMVFASGRRDSEGRAD